MGLEQSPSSMPRKRKHTHLNPVVTLVQQAPAWVSQKRGLCAGEEGAAKTQRRTVLEL